MLESMVPIRPDVPWFIQKVVPNDCNGSAGSSGSPIFRLGGNKVIGVYSTGSGPGITGCGYGIPCELKEAGPIGQPGTNYFGSVELVAAALKADSTFDPSELDPGTGVALLHTASWSTRSFVADENQRLRPATWNLSVREGFELIRYKTGPASSIQCDQPKGYSAPVQTGDQPLLRLPVDSKEDVYAICVIGKRSAESVWQPYAQATRMLRRIDDTYPEITPKVDINDAGINWLLTVRELPNENTFAYSKYGPVASIDCADPQGYTASPGEISVPKDGVARRFCAYATDEAGNPSPTKHYDFQ